MRWFCGEDELIDESRFYHKFQKLKRRILEKFEQLESSV